MMGNRLERQPVALRLLYKIKTYYNAIANVLISHLYYQIIFNIVVKGRESEGHLVNVSETSKQMKIANILKSS